jgi:hypothetical protein
MVLVMKKLQIFIFAALGFLLLEGMLPAQASAQGLQLIAHAGLPEGAGLGFRFVQGPMRWGLSGAAGEEYAVFTGSMAWHFGGRTRKGPQAPWFLSQQLTYSRFADEYGPSQVWLHMDFRVGYCYFPLSWLGLQIDAGPAFPLWKDNRKPEFENPLNSIAHKGRLIIEPALSLSIMVHLPAPMGRRRE